MGRELTFQLPAKKAGIIGIDYNAESLAETKRMAEEHADNFNGHTLDISNKEGVASLAADIIENHMAIDKKYDENQ